MNDSQRIRQFTASVPRCFCCQIRRNFGRGSLASSHAGTRLPIAVIQDTGRSPSVRRGIPRNSRLPVIAASFLRKFCLRHAGRHFVHGKEAVFDFLCRAVYSAYLPCTKVIKRKTPEAGVSEKVSLWLPTAALPASGQRVEVDDFLSARTTGSPVFFLL